MFAFTSFQAYDKDMELFENLAEYYDELYPVTNEFKKFYSQEVADFPKPIKHLTIGSGTGSFEHFLAKDGFDVTGLETVPSLIESANRKRRTQIMSLRFFQMSSLEMCRFLGKKFYNTILVPNGRLMFVKDSTLVAKFFYDCKQLLADEGKLIIVLPNFEKYNSNSIDNLPVRESIRVSLFTKIITKEDGKKFLEQELVTGNGKRLPVTENAEIMAIDKNIIEEHAKNIGFTKFTFYGDFNKGDFTKDSDNLIVVVT